MSLLGFFGKKSGQDDAQRPLIFPVNRAEQDVIIRQYPAIRSAVGYAPTPEEMRQRGVMPVGAWYMHTFDNLVDKATAHAVTRRIAGGICIENYITGQTLDHATEVSVCATSLLSDMLFLFGGDDTFIQLGLRKRTPGEPTYGSKDVPPLSELTDTGWLAWFPRIITEERVRQGLHDPELLPNLDYGATISMRGAMSDALIERKVTDTQLQPLADKAYSHLEAQRAACLPHIRSAQQQSIKTDPHSLF